MPNIQYQQIPLGVPTPVLQNETFAIPACACLVNSSVAIEVGYAQAGPFVAQPTSATTGLQTSATWGRCATAAAVVSAKRIG